jgi:hypothetical protein
MILGKMKDEVMYHTTEIYGDSKRTTPGILDPVIRWT